MTRDITDENYQEEIVTKKRAVHIAELAAMAGLTVEQAVALDARHEIPPHIGIDSVGRWWLTEEAEAWAESFRKRPVEGVRLVGLSAADVAWIKLRRHEEECKRDGGRCGESVRFGVGAPTVAGCCERNLLSEAYEKARSGA